MEVLVKVYNKSNNSLPVYETDGSAGMDVRAFLPENPVYLKPGERTLIDTGLYVEIPKGYEIQVRPRSGLALKKGITVLNTPGTIDSDYRNSIGIILINQGNEIFPILNGDRIAQLVLNEVPQIKWEQVSNKEDLSNTTRGLNGFGSTGK
jgi:dUTP pyrophosphatase